MFFNQASSWCSSCEKREERRGKEELCSGTVGRWHLFTWPSFLSFWSLLQPFEGSLSKVCKMTLEYFHEKQLFVFLDCFWKFVILEKTGGSVERQMARLSEKFLYIVHIFCSRLFCCHSWEWKKLEFGPQEQQVILRPVGAAGGPWVRARWQPPAYLYYLYLMRQHSSVPWSPAPPMG